jgi:hypothetical protein
MLLLAWAVLIIGLLIGELALIQKMANGQAFSYEWPTLAVWSFIFAFTLLVFVISYLGPERLRGWLFSWRIIRRGLIAVAWVVTAVVLFYAEENFRGRRAWNNLRHELEARGGQLDLQAFIPKEIPDEQNFAATPLTIQWFTQRTNTARWEDNYSRAGQQLPSSEDRGPRSFTDLVAWKMAFESLKSRGEKTNRDLKSDQLDSKSRAEAASAVLNGLKDNEQDLAELRAASARPFSRYAVTYNLENPWGILLPHLSRIRNVCRKLQLQACAELSAGQLNKALDDVTFMFLMADSIKREPFLISHLVRIACVQDATQPIWEGLAEHRWTDAQLQALQKRLQQFDFIADMKAPFDCERAAGALTGDLLARGKYHFNDLAGDPNGTSATFADFFGRLMPRGWYEFEKVNGLKLYELQLNGAFDVKSKLVFPSQIASNSAALERAFAGRNPVTTVVRHQLLAAMMSPALARIPLQGARSQVAVDHAALACALERFRLANGNFPESPDALVPKFISQLPDDVITGKPYHYRRNDKEFVLYSVGWDEKDDGGAPGKTLFDEKQGDWVWQYPAK